MATRSLPIGSGDEADVVVLGGGFFGCELAIELREMGFERVVLLERENVILGRASYVNQARVHHGYHYPRSLPTAQRSQRHFERFVADYHHAIHHSTKMVYAIARGSKVNPTQFERFCSTVGAPCRPANSSLTELFDSDLIETVYEVRELAFDAERLASGILERMRRSNIDLRLNATASVADIRDTGIVLRVEDSVPLRTRFLVNATYAGLDKVGIPLRTPLKREVAELVLIRPPPQLSKLAVTVMDGPYFSTMPFPPAGLHSLSHVRFTPHDAVDEGRPAPPSRSNAERMVRDAARYLPCIREAKIISSLFEVKTVLRRSETDDGRPILFERSRQTPNIVSVMGAKLDNIYDARDALRSLGWRPQDAA